mmetsp:Transcript_5792/g.9722  ORF Transcript_5792/g.9722 Transcript_5792/m.9722 type:complete len:250 (+) Transcript_5792:1533-2282(+)
MAGERLMIAVRTSGHDVTCALAVARLIRLDKLEASSVFLLNSIAISIALGLVGRRPLDALCRHLAACFPKPSLARKLEKLPALPAMFLAIAYERFLGLLFFPPPSSAPPRLFIIIIFRIVIIFIIVILATCFFLLLLPFPLLFALLLLLLLEALDHVVLVRQFSQLIARSFNLKGYVHGFQRFPQLSTRFEPHSLPTRLLLFRRGRQPRLLSSFQLCCYILLELSDVHIDGSHFLCILVLRVIATAFAV